MKLHFDAKLWAMNDKTNEKRWVDIEDLVRRWSNRFPEKLKDNTDYVREIREDRKNDLATTDDGSLRLGLAIHPELMEYVTKFHPDFMNSNDDVREFANRFKKFTIPRKV